MLFLGRGRVSQEQSAEDLLKKRFCELDITIDAFSSLVYVGTRTTRPPTDFTGLLDAVKTQLRNTSVRSPRVPGVMFKAVRVRLDLKVLIHRIGYEIGFLPNFKSQCFSKDSHLKEIICSYILKENISFS